MGYARKCLVSLDDTPYYHVISRCVRRAWLWGFDEYAGRDYSHRKAWVLHRLEFLSNLFAIDICAYAVMSNHYHLVLHVDRDRMRSWSDEQVIERWSRLFRIPTIVSRWREGVADDTDIDLARTIIQTWRQRLIDISWFMRCLNEHLARRANAEDECTGRFWEGRFKSQALLDEAGLLTAMVYVDLNPIRAGIADKPEESEFTSIHERIAALQRSASLSSNRFRRVNLKCLLAFRDQAEAHAPSIPMRFHDYLRLVDWTGRMVRTDKSGAIDDEIPSIVNRLSIDPDGWKIAMRVRGNVFGRALGRLDHLRLHAKALGQSRVQGLTQARRLFRATQSRPRP